MARPKKVKKDIPFDIEEVKSYITRLFEIEKEIKVLRLDKSDLKDEFKNKVDMKLVASVVRLVKAELKLKASPETVQDLSELIKDKIGVLVE